MKQAHFEGVIARPGLDAPLPIMDRNAALCAILGQCQEAANSAFARLENVLQRIDPTPDADSKLGQPITGGIKGQAFELSGTLHRLDRLTEMLSEML